MPIYEYKGLDPAGSSRTGIIDADTPRDARARLRDQNVMVTELVVSDISSDEPDKKTPKKKTGWSRAVRIERGIKGDRSLPIYTRQLSTLLRSGIPLAQSLSAVIEQVEHKEIEAIFRDVREQVVRGKSFGEALELHPRLFDDPVSYTHLTLPTNA